MIHQSSVRQWEYARALAGASITLLIDVCVFALYSRPIMYLTLYNCMTHAFTLHDVGSIVIYGAAVMLELFIYGNGSAPLSLCFIPALVVIMHARSLVYMNRLLFVIANTFFMCVYAFPAREHYTHYTLVKISVNMVLIVLFSLKLPYQSSQDDRPA